VYDGKDLNRRIAHNQIPDEIKGRQMVRHQRIPLVLVGSIPTPKFFDEYILKNFEGGFAHK
jgi:hypothetical protein